MNKNGEMVKSAWDVSRFEENITENFDLESGVYKNNYKGLDENKNYWNFGVEGA